MKELKVTDLYKTFGDKTLFDRISFLIHEKDRIGLIGVNGTGKSSLLTILSGRDSGDGDEFSNRQGERLSNWLFAARAKFFSRVSSSRCCFQGDNPLMQTVRDYEKALLRYRV
jgi:ABC transport system ATP-binding/permease protein